MEKLNDPKIIGSKVKELMISRDMTQEQFAEAFCCDSRTIRRWLSQGINRLDLIVEIAKFFEINEKDILF